MRKLFRLYGGFDSRKGPVSESQFQAVLARVSGSFDAFTVICSGGYWKGKRETSYILEFVEVDTPTVRESLRVIASQICFELSQDAILFTSTPVDSDLVTSERIAA